MVKDNYIKEYNKEIDESVKQIKAGEYFTQQEVDVLIEECESGKSEEQKEK